MKRVLLALVIAVVTAMAFPVLPLGGEMFYEEAQDTVMNIDCPTDGVIFTGAAVFIASVWDLCLDGDTIAFAHSAVALPVSAGIHTLLVDLSLPTQYHGDSVRIWALFMGEEQQNCVSDGDYGAGHQPDYPPVSVSERVCRVGDHIDVYSPEPVIYDASGRLLERPVSFWIPTTPGIYFLSDETLQKVVVVE